LEGPLLAGVSRAAVFRQSRKEITIIFALSLGTLADSGELIYPLVVTGKVSMNEIPRIMGEATLLRNIQEPPMKYVLCRENSLADMITNTRALENVEGVKSVEISVNQEVLVSTHLRHSLIREEICRRWKRIEWPNPASIEVPNKEKSSTMSID